MIVFYTLALLAEIIGTVGGFGSSLFFVPLAIHFFGFHRALGITAMLHLFSNVSKIALFREGIDWSLFLRIGITSILLVIVGAWLSRYIPGDTATLVLGIFMCLFAGFLLLRPGFVISPTNTNAAVGGGLAGFMAGLVGTGGAIRGLTLSAFRVDKAVFLATSALIDLGVDATRFGVYVAQDYLVSDDLMLAIPLLLVSGMGSYMGKIILDRLTYERFRLISLLLILLVGLYTLLNP
ncbi:sulfite exporter TauE/SafE family protein [Arsenicibacter rosenii]|uniref:Probable membrane transporter protein n=1 Tax=Arsenicibacter rosenii TaxID=1750698 RepID=A0A1S2VE52_9BACT|nr:sulfite exporter TauE/SafE family protein [Arsenicibacter rosenii]OIN56989.1 hypothetical protein BLX24_21785 [Arsenicibacter rosenii]